MYSIMDVGWDYMMVKVSFNLEILRFVDQV